MDQFGRDGIARWPPGEQQRRLIYSPTSEPEITRSEAVQVLNTFASMLGGWQYMTQTSTETGTAFYASSWENATSSWSATNSITLMGGRFVVDLQSAQAPSVFRQGLGDGGPPHRATPLERVMGQVTDDQIIVGRNANERALALLMECLTDEQKAMFEKNGFFVVEGSRGGRYQIRHGSAGNVYRFDATKRTMRYCCHPSGVPDGDAMLAQKFMLETDEAEFLRLANASAV